MPSEVHESDTASESETNENDNIIKSKEDNNSKPEEVIDLDTSGEVISLDCGKVGKSDLLEESSTEIITPASNAENNSKATVKEQNYNSESTFRRKNARALSCIAGCKSFKLLHRVPSNIDEANLWFNLLGRHDLLNATNISNYRVCNNHFSEKMRSHSGVRLYRWSLPDINLPANSVSPPVVKPLIQVSLSTKTVPQPYTQPPQVTQALVQVAQTTDSVVQTPTQVVQAPIQVLHTSAQTAQTQDNTAQSAAQVLQTPTQVLQTPANVVQSPAPMVHPSKQVLQASKSKQVIQKPNQVLQSPKQIMQTSQQMVQTSQQVIQTPKHVVQAHTSNQVLKTPTQLLQTPKQVLQTSQQMIRASQPMIRTTKQLIQTSPQIINTSQPMIQTSPHFIQTSPQIIRTSQPMIRTSQPIIQTSQSIIQTSQPIIQTSQPIIQTYTQGMKPIRPKPMPQNQFIVLGPPMQQLVNLKQVPTTSPLLFPNTFNPSLVNNQVVQLQTNKPAGGQLSVINPLVVQPTPVHTQYTPNLNGLQMSLQNPVSPGILLESFQRELMKEMLKDELQDAKPVAENVIEIPQHLIVKLVFTKRGEELPEVNKNKCKNAQHECQRCRLNPSDDDSILKKILKIPTKQKVEIGHKSIQCRLDRNYKQKEDKAEEKKNDKKDMKLGAIISQEDKCISTEDYDDFFDLFFVAELPETKDFRYIEDGKCECLFCGKQFESSSYAKTHLQMHREKSKLCCKCGKLFSDSIKTKSHERTCSVADSDDEEDGTVPRKYGKKKRLSGSAYASTAKERICEHCGKYSICLIKHLDHLNSHTGERPHKCSCGSEFRNLPNFYTHRKKFGCKNAPAEIPYGMRLRNRKTGDGIISVPERVKENAEKKSNNIQEKDEIDKEITKPTTTKQKGKRQSVLDPDRYLCKICDIQLKDYTSFRSHRKKHVTERKYVCQLCNNSYKEENTLRGHIKHAHLQKLQCKYCGKQCTPYYMSVHIRKHTGERPFSCVLCEKKFISKVALRKHKWNEHNIGDAIPSYPTTFKCTLCLATFGSKKALVNHMSKPVHLEKENKWKEETGVTIFTCMYCNSSFEHFGKYGNHLGSIHNSHIFRRMEKILKEFEQKTSEAADPHPNAENDSEENDSERETNPENDSERETNCENDSERETNDENDYEGETNAENYSGRESNGGNYSERETNAENDSEMIEEYIDEADIVKMETDGLFDVNPEEILEDEKLEIKHEDIEEICIIKEEDEIVGEEDIAPIEEHMIEFLNFHEVKDFQIEFIDQDDIDCDEPQN